MRVEGRGMRDERPLHNVGHLRVSNLRVRTQAFVAVTVLMMAANGMSEEPHTESIYATKSATSKLEVPLRARVRLPETQVVLTVTKENLALKRENEALKSVNEKLMADKDARIAENDARIADKEARIADKDARIADKDARIADKDARIAALEEQNKPQQLSPSRKLLMDQIKSQNQGSRRRSSKTNGKTKTASQIKSRRRRKRVSSAETSQLSCEKASYGFMHAESDKFTKGAWSRSIDSQPTTS